MTISSTTRKAGPYIGNGTASVFPFAFKVFQASDVEVVRLNVSTNVETTLALTTDYTVSLNQDQDSNPGGSITLVAGALATGYNLVITSDVENLQPTDLTNQGGFYPDVINDALDRATIQIQQLQEGLDRAALLPITSSADAASLVADIVRLADSADNLDIDANNIDAINTVADDIANVNTVATNIASVNTTAGSIANVNTTAANITNVNAVGEDLLEPVSEINTVATSITNVNTVGDNIASVNTVAGNNSNVTTVATDIANVNTVGGAIANVNVTAANIENVNAVGSDLLEPTSEINTVATDIANVNTVGTNISNVNTVAGISANVTTVAGISANVTTVATNNANVTTVATNITNVNSVGGSISDVNTVATNIVAVNSAYTNLAAIIDAPNQAAAAANSAAQAAASAASGMYSAVQDKSANYTIVAADAGDLIRVTTTSGAVTITLPAISSVGDGFKIAVVKWTADANVVNIARSGSDTINGATSAQIGSQYSQIILVADAETSTWFASQSGLGATNINVDTFSGNGSTTAFTLTSDPSTKNNTSVFISGVYQQKSTYSLSGTTLTFSTAPPSGTANIEVAYSTPLAIGTPSDGTVSTSKIVDGAVTAAKIAANAVDNTKLASGAAVANIGYTPRNFADGITGKFNGISANGAIPTSYFGGFIYIDSTATAISLPQASTVNAGSVLWMQNTTPGNNVTISAYSGDFIWKDTSVSSFVLPYLDRICLIRSVSNGWHVIAATKAPSYEGSTAATHSPNTWYQVGVDRFVTLNLTGSYRNQMNVYAGPSTSSYTQILRAGDDINNNTKYGGLSFWIKAGSYFYCENAAEGWETQSIYSWALA